MKERFLPIGTVVLLKGAKTPLMITSYCIFPTGKQIKNGQEIDPEQKMYEYGACTYPHGVIDRSIVNAFDHNQIEEILFMGYETKDSEELSQLLNGGYEIYKKKFEEA